MNTPGKIAAFFDLDGTLLAPPSLEWRFIGYLIERDEIRTENMTHWVAESARTLRHGWRSAVFANKHYLAGIHESFVEEWANTTTHGSLPWFAQGIDRMRRHLECRHRVVLVTGTLGPLAHSIANHLPPSVEIHATNLEIRDGCFTGRICGKHLSFEEKMRVIGERAAEFDLDLVQSFAYGNEISDVEMLQAVGRPAAVNASWSLKREARRRGWRVYSWRDSPEEKGRRANTARALKEAR